MHTHLLPLDEPSTWLIALAFLVVLVLASRAVERLTGRTGPPAPGRKRIAYVAVIAAGALGTVTWIEHLLHGGESPVLVGIVWGLWSLVAQGFFGKPADR